MLVDTLSVQMRPKRFKDIVGQKSVVARMMGAIKDKKVPKTVAILGPYGTGKTTLARIFARYINCDTNNACGKCENCSYGDSHPDVEEMNAASARGIDEVRAILERATYSPRIAKNRIYIIDEMQQWTPQAAQAMLKTLEEPPPNVMFILCSMEPEKLSGAVLSRCSRFQLERIKRDDVIERLKTVCTQLKKNIPESVLDKIAELSGGHMRDALQFLEAVIQFAAAKTDEKNVEKALQKALSQTVDVKEEIVAMKVLLSIYTGSTKNIMAALLDSGDNISMLNKMSTFNQYAIEKILVGSHPDIWNTANNTKFFTAIETRVKDKKITDDEEKFLKMLLETSSTINRLKVSFGTFMLNERALLSAELLSLAVRFAKR